MSQFLEQFRETTRRLHLADSTEQSYTNWVKRYFLYHGYPSADAIARAPRDDIEAFLCHLANDLNLSTSSMNQALSALVFMYKNVVRVELPDLSIPQLKSIKALQHPLDEREAEALLSRMDGETFLLAALMYGGGLRVKEACSLRVQDLDFICHEIRVANTKDGDHRFTFLPKRIIEPLQAHLHLVKDQHTRDLAAGHGYAWLPPALRRKYPNAEREWLWQYVFPSNKLSRHRREPENPTLYRFHVSPSTVARQPYEADFAAYLNAQFRIPAERIYQVNSRKADE